jgi:hypothetical protein
MPPPTIGGEAGDAVVGDATGRSQPARTFFGMSPEELLEPPFAF